MELGLKKKSIEVYDIVFCGTAAHEENTEMIVPDMSPDILRIIGARGNAYVRERCAREGKIDIGGNIKGAVLYIAEGDKKIRKLELSMPFAYVIDDSRITPDSRICVETILRSVDVREINPRKVAVRANVEVRAKAYERKNLELCSGIESADEYGIQQHSRNVGIYLPVIVKDKSFTITDECELSSDEVSLGEMLTTDVELYRTDMKVIGNKAIVKGIAAIKYMYNHEDESPASGEVEIPFSQIIDVDGMDEDYDLHIKMSVRGSEILPQYDAAGQARYMTINILCDACIVAYLRGDIDCVDDVYSTKHEIDINRDHQECVKLCDRMDKRVAVSETIEAGTNIKRVLDVSVSLMPYSRRREEDGEVLGNDASISVIYVGEDDSVYCASRRTSVICPLALSSANNYECDVAVKGKSFSANSGSEVTVRFFTDYDITETEAQQVQAISAVALDPDNECDMTSRPSITIKRLDHECELWSLAKEHRTTVDEIVMANRIDKAALIEAGRMVLIPKKR